MNRSLKLELPPTPIARWTWRADTLPTSGDFRHGHRDDQAAQLFVIFERRGLGTPTAINYIWDTEAPVGSFGDYRVPPFIHIKTIVVTNGADSLGLWRHVERDVLADYRRHFRRDPPRIAAIRFQANSQHTASTAFGCLSELTLQPPP